MIDGLIAFLKAQTRGQLIGLLLMQVSVFLFLGVLTAQSGISKERINACANRFSIGEAMSKYGYWTADGLCEDLLNGKIKLK